MRRIVWPYPNLKISTDTSTIHLFLVMFYILSVKKQNTTKQCSGYLSENAMLAATPAVYVS